MTQSDNGHAADDRLGAEFAQPPLASPLSPSPLRSLKKVEDLKHKTQSQLERNKVRITINIEASFLFFVFLFSAPFIVKFEFLAAVMAMLGDAVLVGEGALVVGDEGVGAGLAHAVRGGAAEGGSEDMASLVVTRVFEFIPSAHSKHVILTVLHVNVNNSRFSVGSTQFKNFTFR